MAPPVRGQQATAGFDFATTRPIREPRTGSAAPQLEETTSDDGIRGSQDDGTAETAPTPSRMTASPPTTSPPYWLLQYPQNSNNNSNNNNNTAGLSEDSMFESGGITMRDNESEDWGGRNSACWARSVEIPDYVVVNGSATNIGAFVVFNIRVEPINGSRMNIRKRYSEFDDFRRKLVQTFPNFEAAVPPLPPKSLISKFGHPFLEKRRAALQYFLHCILLNPEFSASPVLKEFLFA